jgi:TRAP-type uncharacterized transport system substrate-binding protein
MRFLGRVVALFVSASALVAQAQNLSIATGGTGGVYYPLGGGMAAVLSKYVPGMQATAEVTGGSVANLQLIGTGKPYLGMTMADATLDAYKGQDKFTGKPVPVRTLMVMYPNRMHVVSIEGSGVAKMADLKGKRVSTGSGGSATEVMAFRVIEAAGLDKDKDLRRERLGVAESVNAIKDRKIDAFFWVGGLPTVIPKDIYRGMDADNKQATVMNLLVAHQNMDEKTAYNILKAVFDHKEELVRVHKEAENFRLENQKKEASPIPWHPGAVKYFSEKGIKLQ